MNIEEALRYGIKKLKNGNIDEPIIKVRILLSYILKRNREYVITHVNQRLNEMETNQFNIYIKRLLNNEPIQYILGKQEFMGLEFLVNENTLIPRCDTEILVEEVIKLCKLYMKRKFNR